MLCFYGECLPSRCKFNFPATPHLDIPDNLPVHLTIANIKVIVVDYGRSCAGFFAPLMYPTLPNAPSGPPLMVLALATNGAATPPPALR
jgi:hypothetical protein